MSFSPTLRLQYHWKWWQSLRSTAYFGKITQNSMLCLKEGLIHCEKYRPMSACAVHAVTRWPNSFANFDILHIKGPFYSINRSAVGQNRFYLSTNEISMQ